MSPADLIRDYGLTPDDLVVHAGGGGVELLHELRRFGCRVLRLDPAAVGWEGDVDTLRVELTPAAEKSVRDRYGPVSLVLADGVVLKADKRPVARAA